MSDDGDSQVKVLSPKSPKNVDELKVEVLQRRDRIKEKNKYYDQRGTVVTKQDLDRRPLGLSSKQKKHDKITRYDTNDRIQLFSSFYGLGSRRHGSRNRLH